MFINHRNIKKNLGSNDLSLKLDLAGFKNNISTPVSSNNIIIAQGALQFSSTTTNIYIHTCDLVEKCHFSNTAELNACLSINILLKGRVKYQLSQQAYEFSTQKEQPMVIVNAINQSEIFTRFMVPNQRVKKVNISCNKEWLFERCINTKDIALLNTLFLDKEKVTHWIADENLIVLAQQLLENVDDKSLNNQLLSERIGLEVLQIAICKLKQLKNDKHKTYAITCDHKGPTNLLSQVNDLLDQKLSLEEIARELAMSVSTLQRKFKALYHVTVIEYHRIKKLNQSRKHLIIDELSIGETAYLAGYKYTSNFNHAFKQQFKLTPTEFLQQHKS